MTLVPDEMTLVPDEMTLVPDAAALPPDGLPPTTWRRSLPVNRRNVSFFSTSFLDENC